MLSELNGQHRTHRVRSIRQPELKLSVCMLMSSCPPMIGVSGSSADDSARYGINANITIAATAA